MTLKDGSPEALLLKKINDKGTPVGFRVLLKEDLRNGEEFSRVEKRKAIWNLLENDLVDLNEDYKIIPKEAPSAAS